MNITLDKQSTTEGKIKISLTQSDYLPKVEAKLKEYSRKANIKGFRQGKVPPGVIKKMFGKSVLADEINHLIAHSVSDYIKDNKLKTLGEPLPNDDKIQHIDWETQKDFEFEFQIGMVEDFSVELSEKIKLTANKIEVDQKVIDETLKDLKKRFGKWTSPELSEVTDVLHGEVTQKGETLGKEKKEESYIDIDKVEKKEQNKFKGLKKGDTVEFDAEKTFQTTEAKSRALNRDEKEAKEATGKYAFTVTSINRLEEPNLDQDFFNTVFGKDIVKTEKDFINKIKETISENYQRETDYLLNHQIQDEYVKRTSITMPENFLKNWIRKNNNEISEEAIEKEFGAYKDTLKWDLIKKQIAEEKSIAIQPEEVREKAKQLIAEQFGGAAIATQLGDKFDEIVNNYLVGQEGKNENFMRVYNQLYQEKILTVIKENIAIEEKKISLDEFKKIVTEYTAKQ